MLGSHSLARRLRVQTAMRGSDKKRLVVPGPNAFTWRHLEQIPNRERFEFLPVLKYGDLATNEPPSFAALLSEVEAAMQDGARMDGIVAFWDFPVTSLAALVAERYGLPGPGLLSTIKCEHKFWCRCLQKEAIPNVVPAFERVDPFDQDAIAKTQLKFPFWLKPIKSAASNLGFRIESTQDYERALAETRERIHIYGKPFLEALQHVEMPAELARLGSNYCIAESIIDGEQVTLEGYALNGEIYFHGAVDSIRQSNHSTFSRYQYPSSLDPEVISEMQRLSRTILQHVGFGTGTFNVEFFYDEESSQIWLLEINPRISQSHAALFQLVNGAPNFSEMVHVALGETPPARQPGQYKLAAKLFYRTVLEDAYVTTVPSKDELAAIEKSLDGVEVQLSVGVGQKLSDLPWQDSYSYELATLHVGGDSEGEILQKYQECVDHLTFGFKNMDDVALDDGHHRVSAIPQLVNSRSKGQ